MFLTSDPIRAKRRLSDFGLCVEAGGNSGLDSFVPRYGSIFAIAAWEAFIVPYLAVHAPDIITQVEQTSTELPAVTFRLIFFLTVITLSLGFVLLGIVAIGSRVMPRVAGLLVLVGTPLFWLGAVVFSHGSTGNAVTIGGAALLGVGISWFGYAQQRGSSRRNSGDIIGF